MVASSIIESLWRDISLLSTVAHRSSSRRDALVVFSNRRLVDFDTLLIDSTSTAHCIIYVFCLNVVGQSTQSTITKQQVDVF